MMFVKRDRWIPAGSMTFRQFLAHGHEGHEASMADWELHQTAVFPEVRVKRTIEVRGADCVSSDLAMSFCALFTGLLYCASALDEGLLLATEIERHGAHADRFGVACRDGMHGAFGGRPIADWARDLGAIADRGLRTCLPADRALLDPLLSLVQAGRSPADDLIDAWRRDPSPASIVRAVAY
jgi:glutamate--cysteine ligase